LANQSSVAPVFWVLLMHRERMNYDSDSRAEKSTTTKEKIRQPASLTQQKEAHYFYFFYFTLTVLIFFEIHLISHS
jgi:hypothetical protein